MKDFVLRAEILNALHRWPLIMAFFLAGSLAGAIAGVLWPSPYRAVTEMAVSLDPYRFSDDRYVAAFSKVEFRTPDDYKHWQMSQLTVLAYSDEYVGETLVRLRAQDAAWQAVEIPALRLMLRLYWRNAGRWRVTAEAGDPHQARQAVTTWEAVILEKTDQALSQSREIFVRDLELQQVSRILAATVARAQELPEIKAAVLRQRETLAGSSQPVPLSVRWQLLSLAGRVAGLDLAWQELIDSAPAEGSAPQEFQAWIDLLLAAIDQESAALAERQETLGGQQATASAAWEQTLAGGRGLSPSLSLQDVGSQPPQVSRVRPTSLAALLGGLLGFLTWVFGGLVVLAHEGRA